jgi:hypothetical protein
MTASWGDALLGIVAMRGIATIGYFGYQWNITRKVKNTRAKVALAYDALWEARDMTHKSGYEEYIQLKEEQYQDAMEEWGKVTASSFFTPEGIPRRH